MHRTRKKKKISEITQTRTQVVCERDRIGNLPDEILVHILSFLHIKNAVRTSILSTRWRYLWTWNPSLDFSYCKPTVIDQCLDLHRAPKLRSLRYCSIFYGVDPVTEALSRWLRYAATHSVEELSLFLANPYQDNYPLSLSECQTLMHLTLRDGKLNLSVNFRGFKSLVTLCLKKVLIKEEVLCTLISTCDLLENLEVFGCTFAEKRHRISSTNSRFRNLKIISFQERRSPGTLEINAPSLLFFTCRGWKLSWSDFSHLCEADLRFISFDSSWNEDLEGWRRLLSAMISLRTLFAGDWLFQKPKCRKHLPVPFHDHFVFKNLKELDVLIKDKGSKDYLASFMSLLKACPALETVRLYLVSGLERDRCVRYDKVRLWLKEIRDPIFSHDRLKTLELGGFMSTKTELLLLKFLLEKTIALESLILKLRKEINNSELLRNELTLHKASPNAQIIIQQRDVTMSKRTQKYLKNILCMSAVLF